MYVLMCENYNMEFLPAAKNADIGTERFLDPSALWILTLKGTPPFLQILISSPIKGLKRKEMESDVSKNWFLVKSGIAWIYFRHFPGLPIIAEQWLIS